MKVESLSDIAHWKATQFRTFLLYVGPLILKDVDKSVYEHFSLLHCSVSILLSNRHLQKFGYDLTDTLMKNFVSHCRKIYGVQYLVYNIHSLIHITDDARVFGTLDNISAFPFENYLGKLKTLVRSPNNPLQQLFRRLSEPNSINISENNACNILYLSEHTAGPVILGNNKSHLYKTILLKETQLSIKCHSIANCYCITVDNKVIQIENIIRDTENKCFLIAREYMQYESLYSYPFESTDLQINIAQVLSELKKYPLKNVVTKCLLFPFLKDSTSKKFVSFPLLHNLNA